MSLTLAVVLLALTAVSLALLAGYVWLHRGAQPRASTLMTVLLSAVAFWTVCYLLEIVLVDPTLKLIAWRLKFVGIVTVALSWFLLSLAITEHFAWVTPRRAWLLAFMPILTQIVIWTNALHGIFWSSVAVEAASSGYSIVVTTNNFGFWIHAVYSYTLIMAGTAVLLRFYLRAPNTYRMQLTALFIAVAAPLVSNAVTLFGNLLIDLTPFAFAVTGITMTLGVLRFKLLTVAPTARDLVIDSMTDGLIVLDNQDRVVDVNRVAAGWIGQDTRAVLGKTLGTIMPDLVSNLATAQRFRVGNSLQNEITLTRRGEPHVFDMRLSPIVTVNGRVTGQVLLLHDITERRRAAERIRVQNEELMRTNTELEKARRLAEEATRLKDQFLANMSHELRTPLNAIMGYSEILIAGLGGELTPEQTHYLERVYANSEQLLRLINDVLDIARIEVNEMRLDPQPFTIRPWLDGVVDTFRKAAAERGLSFDVEVDDTLPTRAMADSGRLGQIITNLIANAIKFTEKGGVHVKVARFGTVDWSFVVKDTGIGIPPEAHALVFEPFRQVDGSERRKYGGTGLGLAITRQITIMMKGSITLDSTPGKGTTFTVTLPLHPVSEAQTAG